MQTTLLLAAALFEQADAEAACGALAPQAQGALLGRMRRSNCREQRMPATWSDGAAHLQWLARAFGVEAAPPPTAAYVWQSPRQVWFCDPVHLLMGRERTVLTPVERPALTPQESAALLDDVAHAAGDAGASIEEHGGRWFLSVPEPWRLQTVPLEAALGASVEARLPRGPDAARFRRLLNDIQMRWHANPVNVQRESRGEPVANGVWLHGGGIRMPLPARQFDEVEGSDAVLAGWQAAAALPQPAPRQPRRLVVWTELFNPWWRKDWAAWARAWSGLQQRFATARLETAQIVACGRRHCAHFGPAGPWRRLRPHDLRPCLTEPS